MQAMIIFFKDSVTEFLLGNNHSVGRFREFLNRLHELFIRRNDNTAIRELIVQSCEVHLAKQYPTPETKDSFLGHIATAALKISDQGLFKNAIRSTATVLHEDVFFTLGEALHAQCAFITEGELVISTTSIAHEAHHYGVSLNIPFDIIAELHKLWRRLKQFRRGFLKSNPNRFNES